MSLAHTEMSDAAAATAAFFGFLGLVVGLFGKSFYPGLVRTGKTKIPTWSGRLWFLSFAATMFYMSLNHFLSRH
jgi:hypothetical protein